MIIVFFILIFVFEKELVAIFATFLIALRILTKKNKFMARTKQRLEVLEGWKRQLERDRKYGGKIKSSLLNEKKK